MKNNKQITKTISSGCITDTEIILSPDSLDSILEWLDSNSYSVIECLGLINHPGGRIVVSNSYSFKNKDNICNNDQNKNTLKETIHEANSCFNKDPMNAGANLLFCLRLNKKINLQRKLSKIFILGSWFLGILFILIFGALLTSILIGYEELIKEFWVFIAGFLFGILLIYTGYKGRGPLFFGDPDWFIKAMIRYKTKDIDGNRKWEIFNPN